MCDVHLIETMMQATTAAGKCDYCSASVDGPAWIVQGRLDDGSEGLYQFIYCCAPDNCLLAAEQDEEAIAAGDGCFSYGSGQRIA